MKSEQIRQSRSCSTPSSVITLDGCEDECGCTVCPTSSSSRGGDRNRFSELNDPDDQRSRLSTRRVQAAGI